jgi:hypothetical protein
MLLRNSRKTGAPRRFSSAEFLLCLAARKNAPFALLRNSRKTGAPRRSGSAEFLSCMAAREDAPFAPLRNSRKTGAPRRSGSAEFLSFMAAREDAPFALLRNTLPGSLFSVTCKTTKYPAFRRNRAHPEASSFPVGPAHAGAALLRNSRKTGVPAPLLFCGVPLLYGGAGRRALCA